MKEGTSRTTEIKARLRPRDHLKNLKKMLHSAIKLTFYSLKEIIVECKPELTDLTQLNPRTRDM